MSTLQELATVVAAVAEQVGPSVVRVGRGAGVVVAEGRVLTNAHNLRGSEVRVRFADGHRAEGELVGVDVDGDLAVIAVDTGSAPPVTWSEGDGAAGLGGVVFALAPTRNGPRVTVGTVSAVGQGFRGPRGRLITDAIEHTAPMARGSSGGPVVDEGGALVGLNTHRASDGFYLAVPATAELRERVDALAAGETRKRARLGIAVTPTHIATRMRAAVGLDDRPGLLVRGVDPDSPAGRAGVRRGDLIVSADGTAIEHSDELFAFLDALAPDATVTLGIVRGTEELSLEVTFGDA